ncbi:uncharacterized protein PHACADRAFT_253168 [Phanerochaete carnosa HHB-10118-sp]|uniref:Uncharacterized protein n=1 Tax=Phanerochaete carnosa (strain HHB-10118-sp) TaxID=650164 RepID=K5V7D2_PHACS|nr:uncharacterized protein PHACADRAFT_253168 [Phanerochaete carnosa HHB-10118-sp]EKM58681.1 hypothetical protein PHACADRAFT_253168 [Phanerochaete carnosa HHB-10118-sp]
MDWDPEIFDRLAFEDHLDDLGILGDHAVDELLVRTTENTRSGNEFGFKPTHLNIGTLKGHTFYSGFDSRVERNGLNIQKPTGEPLPSSFWIRFKEEVVPKPVSSHSYQF